MLPEKYFIDDQQWIDNQIRQLPVELWDSTAKHYTRVYIEAYDLLAGKGTLLQTQNARTTANTRLRRYVDAVTKKALHGGRASTQSKG